MLRDFKKEKIIKLFITLLTSIIIVFSILFYWNFIHQNELEKFIYKKYLREFGFSKTENPTEEEIQPDNIYQMHGNQITVKTLDLNQKFDIIAKQLDDIVKNHFDIWNLGSKLRTGLFHNKYLNNLDVE